VIFMSNIKHDPQEDDPEKKKLIDEAGELAKMKFASFPGYKSHMIWNEQKTILKEKFGMDWKSPADMNPEIVFE
jgi:hypothetical protein